MATKKIENTVMNKKGPFARCKAFDYDELEKTGRFGNWALQGISFRRKDLWLILTKDSRCERGEYAEELDVVASTKTEAARIAKAVIAEEYQPDIYVARIIWQGQNF